MKEEEKYSSSIPAGPPSLLKAAETDFVKVTFMSRHLIKRNSL